MCIELSLSSYKRSYKIKRKRKKEAKKIRKNRLKQFLQFSTGSISVRTESRLVKFLDAFRVK